MWIEASDADNARLGNLEVLGAVLTLGVKREAKPVRAHHARGVEDDA